MTRRQYLKGIRRRLVRYAGQHQYLLGLANAIHETQAIRRENRMLDMLLAPADYSVRRSPAAYDFVSVPRSFRRAFGRRFTVLRPTARWCS